jgi:hypothetical protein
MGLFKSLFVDSWHQSGIEADIELGLRKKFPLFNWKHPAAQVYIKAGATDVWDMSEQRSVKGTLLHDTLVLMTQMKIAAKCGLIPPADEED